MDGIFAHTLRVRYYEVDCNGLVKPAAVFNFMQDAAASHVRQLGLSVADLKKKNLTWVISRLHLRLLQYPRGNDKITIHTWPSTRDGLFSCREYNICDEEGRALALATSSWAAVNITTRRPVRLKDNLPDFPLNSERAIEDDFPSLPPLGRIDHEQCFQVRRSDLDINRHVNNAVYVDWALETVPPSIAERYRLAEIEVGFRGEALHGDTIVSRCGIFPVSHDEIKSVHQLVNESNGKELTRLRFSWRLLDNGQKAAA